MTNKVIMIEEPRHSIANAAEFGDLTVLFAKGERRPSIFRREQYERVLKWKLEECGFDVHNDYVLVSGPTLSIALLVAVIGSSVKLLGFDAAAERYYPLEGVSA